MTLYPFFPFFLATWTWSIKGAVLFPSKLALRESMYVDDDDEMT